MEICYKVFDRFEKSYHYFYSRREAKVFRNSANPGAKIRLASVEIARLGFYRAI